MISLPKLITTDAEAPASGLMAGKADTSAQDFLSLLSGAMAGTTAQGEGETLTLADLQAAGGKLTKGLLAKDADVAQPRSVAAQLADILGRQSAKADLKADAQAEETAQDQALNPLLTTGLKNDTLAILSKAAKADDDESTTLNEEELAGLNALMAMLPHQQNAIVAPTTSTAVTASATQGINLTPTVKGADAALTSSDVKGDKGQSATAAKGEQTALNSQLQSADNGQQTAVQPSASAVKADEHAALQAINTTVSAAPAVSTAAPAQASAPVAAPVISAPLGSHEWQQTISQNITMFTRQGKQSAELRLHPEDLGQVQISLKIDDNQAQLQMVSPHSHVRAALEAALPVLRTNLAESGIELSQSSISSESFAGQQQSSSQQQQASRSGGREIFGADDDESIAVPASLQSASRGNNAVDIFA
ncbi:flagellar hook length control protein FliK [Enterobacter sp.]|uniref:flagellar hook length control protein FliK n=1 Tax=Enterobacter sp. TaxID=42895 RepID=UPI002982466C|nr:flagellar hook length control protein FliK [Enterobacter sp.]